MTRPGSRRRRAAALAACLLAAGIVAAGCGDGNDDASTTSATSAAPPPKAQSEKEINDTIDQFYSDDNAAKCQTLSEGALKTMGGMDHCLNNDAVATLTPHKVFKITITGTKAKVHLKAGDTVSNVFLVYEDGAWKWDVPPPLYVQL